MQDGSYGVAAQPIGKARLRGKGDRLPWWMRLLAATSGRLQAIRLSNTFIINKMHFKCEHENGHIRLQKNVIIYR
jgi:hypothetical protein